LVSWRRVKFSLQNINTVKIKLLKVAFAGNNYKPAYVAEDTRQIKKMCELLETDHTVWNREQLDVIGHMAARGECDMVDYGTEIFITLDEPQQGKKNAKSGGFQFHIGEANPENAYLTNEIGVDIAVLRRVLPDGYASDGDQEAADSCLDDTQWQALIDELDFSKRRNEGLLALKIWLQEVETNGIDHTTILDELKWAHAIVKDARGVETPTARRSTPVFSLFILMDDGTWIQPSFCIDLDASAPCMQEKEIRQIAEEHWGGFCSYGLQEDLAVSHEHAVKIVI